MDRDFTQAKLEELKAQIEQIKQTDYNAVTDFLGDIWYYAKEAAGWLDIENYLDDVEEYHKEVLDQHNTTNARLEALFEAAQTVDDNYQSTFSQGSEKIGVLTKKMEALTGSIDPDGGPFTRESILNACIPLNEEIDAAQTTMDTIFDAEISYLENEVAKDAALGLAKGVISVIATIGACATPMAPLAIAVMGWKVINSVISVPSDFMALTAIITGKCVVSDNKETRLYCLQEASDYEGYDGLADGIEGEFDVNPWPIRTIDFLAGLYSVVDIFTDDGGSESDATGDVISKLQKPIEYVIALADEWPSEVFKKVWEETTVGKLFKKLGDVEETAEKLFGLQEGTFKKQETDFINDPSSLIFFLEPIGAG